MAPSQVSGPKMRNLLFLVVLGLLAVVHSTPVTPEAQEDIYEEVMMEHFLIKDHPRISTTQAPKRISNQQPSTESKESDMIEDWASGDDDVLSFVFPQHGGKQLTTSTSHSNARSSTSKVLRRHTDHSSVPTHYIDDKEIEFGSGDDSMEEARNVNMEMGTSTSTAAHIKPNTPLKSEDSVLVAKKVPQLGTVQQQQVDKNVKSSMPQNSTGQSTPSWIIIVGFIVGVAALVMLCVAIATRDKWNGPKQAAQLETTTSSSNQQREQEMETFLLKEKPRENGKAAEYTVIPLNELPEKCSAQ